MDKYIKVKCENCLQVYEVRRTPEIKETTKHITVNFCCFKCEDSATDYYTETQHETELIENENSNPNQLTIKF